MILLKEAFLIFISFLSTLNLLIDIYTGIKAFRTSKITHSIPKANPTFFITLPAPGLLSSDISLISIFLKSLGII